MCRTHNTVQYVTTALVCVGYRVMRYYELFLLTKIGTIVSSSKGTLLLPTSSMFSWFVCALLAGFLSAAASLSAKLSLGADYTRDMCKLTMEKYGGTTDCDWLHAPLRLLCGALLFTCNTVMWTFFSKALRHCSSTARATVTTTASNFIFSALLGRVIFGETHAVLWWTGISVTLCGLLVLHLSTPQSSPQGEGKKDD